MDEYREEFLVQVNRVIAIGDAYSILHIARVRMLRESKLTVIFGEWYKPYRLLCHAQKYLAAKLSDMSIC